MNNKVNDLTVLEECLEKPCMVSLSKLAEKQLKKIPASIKEALVIWMDTITEYGIGHARKMPDYHDEPLKGQRRGQRSVRLNRAYRVIYTECDNELVIEIFVLEVNKHEYKK